MSKSLSYDTATVERLNHLFNTDVISVQSVTSEAVQYKNAISAGADWVQIECGSTDVEDPTFSIAIGIREKTVMVDVPKDVAMDDAMKDVIDAIVLAGIPEDTDSLVRIVQGVRQANRSLIEQQQELTLSDNAVRITPYIKNGVTSGIDIAHNDAIVARIVPHGDVLGLHVGDDTDTAYVPLKR